MKTAKYFSATWCGPCKQFKPIMEELSNEGYNVEFIDGDENKQVAIAANIRSIPTTLIMDGDEEINRIVGVRTKEEMIKELS